MEALEAALQRERRSAAEKDARQKLNVDRLRRQIADLQVRCTTIECIPNVHLVHLPDRACADEQLMEQLQTKISGGRGTDLYYQEIAK